MSRVKLLIRPDSGSAPADRPGGQKHIRRKLCHLMQDGIIMRRDQELIGFYDLFCKINIHAIGIFLAFCLLILLTFF
jgi:hypothetical protein